MAQFGACALTNIVKCELARGKHSLSSMMRALVISLLSAGPGWAVVWSNGSQVDTRSFVQRVDAENLWQELISQNPNAVLYKEGQLLGSR
jgi:hypothetical protein